VSGPQRRKARELIPPRMRARAIGWAESALARAGYRLQAAGEGLSPEEQRRSRLLRTLAVDLVLDVGANAGQYVRDLRRIGYRGRIVSFEPLSAAFAKLERACANDATWDCRRLALGSTAGSSEINVAGNSYSSSLLGMEERHERSAPESAYVGTETIEVATLDSVFGEVAGDASRAYLKLDVQGYEIEVLRGAAESLPRVVAVQAELSLVPLYEGGPVMREVMDHLDGLGFRLAGLEGGHWDRATGEMLQADGVFVREGAL
jgi:FkbM family methyltransferase